MRPDRRVKPASPLASAFASFLCLACVGAYASQLFLGRWQTDEYSLFTIERVRGWHALVPRLAYSPRPVSELLLALYGRVVLATTFLGLLWVATLTLSTMTARSALPPSRLRIVLAAGLAASLFAFVLVNDAITETFYWPMAAAAYMPTAGSALVLLFLLSRPLSQSTRLFSGSALLVAAGSSEVGAALALGFAAAAVLDLLVRRRRPALADAWWMAPGLLACLVFVTLLSVRAGMRELGAASHPATGHVGLAVLLAARQLGSDILGDPDQHGPLSIVAAFATKLLFASGFASMFRLSGGTLPRRPHALLAVSLATASFFSLFAAYLHYGDACCERQATTRAWLIDLLIVLAAASLMARFLPTRRLQDWRLAWLPGLLLVASLAPVLGRIDGMRQDFAARTLAIQSRTRTWSSGLGDRTSTMKFYIPPDGTSMLVRGTAEPIGTFAAAGAPEMIAAVAAFFRKSTVIVCQPWQTEKSWLLDGRFIPACPPHPGPPDVVYDSRR